MNTIFIAPLNWGLGHATRDLPLIKAFLERGDRVIVAAHDRAKMLLQSEVSACEFVDFPEYPIRYPQTSFFVTRFMFVIYPQMLIAMFKEKKEEDGHEVDHHLLVGILDGHLVLKEGGNGHQDGQ